MSVEVMQSPVPSPLFGDSGFIVHHIPRSFPTYHPCPADSAPFARLLAATRPLPVVEVQKFSDKIRIDHALEIVHCALIHSFIPPCFL